LREGVSEPSFDQETEAEESEEESDPGESGAYLWVHDEHVERWIEDEVDRDETDWGWHRTAESGLQRGAVRTNHAFEVGVASWKDRRGYRRRKNEEPKAKTGWNRRESWRRGTKNCDRILLNVLTIMTPILKDGY